MYEVTVKLPIGFISDCHGQVEKIDRILQKHPEVTQWVFLGDLVDFQVPELNRITGNWLLQNVDKMIFIKGNHDHVSSRAHINLDYLHAHEISKFHMSCRLNLPDRTHLLCYHSKPGNFWGFIDKDIYTEREFIDDFPLLSDDTRAVAIGHNHRTFTQEYQGVSTVIWSPGSIIDNCYAIYDGSIRMLKL